MSQAKHASKRKRRGKAIPVLRAAGLSLSLASGASAAIAAPAAEVPTRNSGVGHENTLREEEIFDVSLATFHVFDEENAGTRRPGVRLAMAGSCACAGCGSCGPCWTGTYYTGSVIGGAAHPLPQAAKPARKHKHPSKRTQVPKG